MPLTNIINEIENDIKKEKVLSLNVPLFIKDRKLQKNNIKNITADYLPLDICYGTVYLIKNKTIIQISTNYEQELIVDPIKDYRSLFYNSVTRHKSIVLIHHIELSDIKAFANPNSILSMDEYTSYNIEKTINFILSFLKCNFDLYTINKNLIN
jgi:hypothetical protein